MEFRLLGPVEVVKDAESLELGSRKQRTVLAVLAANPDKPVSVDQCIQAVWGEEAPPGAVRSLQTYVSNLRGVIDPDRSGIIEGLDGAYRLRVPTRCSIDWREFEKLSQFDDPENLEKAMMLWRGRPLEDVEADWAHALVTDWEQQRLVTIERWADMMLDRGDSAELIPTLERLLEEHPLHEPLWERLMLALYREGRQADALRSYQTIKDRLAEELGIDPSPGLQELEERILLQDPSLAPTPTIPTNVPKPVSPTIGRVKELEYLDELLANSRLLTITGAGGVGKTTVARELARRRLDDFPHGAWWLELASLTDTTHLLSDIFGAMRLPPPTGGDPIESLCRHLAQTTTLVVFDNCEHLIEPVASIVEAILKSAAEVKVIATSREPLALPGEVSWPLPPLTAPEPGTTTTETILATDAGALFQTRAAQASPGFEVTEGNASRVASICRRLDGLPFAIELAAARLRSMGIAELEEKLDDRFDLLTGGSRTAVPHHRTLRGTVEWSYELLEPAQQDIYASLSVFRGGFGLEAVEAVSGSEETPNLVDSLVANSLLLVERDNDRVRYRMLETIREHAQEVLSASGRLEETQTAHLSWISELVRHGARQLEGQDGPLWMKRFRKETDNIRAALEYAAENDPVTGAAISAGLARFWFAYATEHDVTTLEDATSFLDEGRRWSEQMLGAADELPEKVRARLLTALGGLLLVRLGRLEEATAHLTEARSLWENIGDTRNQGWANFYLGVVSWARIPIEETVAQFERSLSLHQEAEDTFGTVMSQLLLGLSLTVAGEYDEAKKYLDSFTGTAEKVGAPVLTAHASDSVSLWAVASGQPSDEYWDTIQSAIEEFRQIPNHACLCHAIHTAAALMAATGDLENAARSLGAVRSIRQRLGMVVPPYEDRTELVEELGLNRLDEETRRAAESEGHAMDPQDGISWVLDQIEAKKAISSSPT